VSIVYNYQIPVFLMFIDVEVVDDTNLVHVDLSAKSMTSLTTFRLTDTFPLMGPPSKYETSNRLKFDDNSLTLRDHWCRGGIADGRNALLSTIFWLDKLEESIPC